MSRSRVATLALILAVFAAGCTDQYAGRLPVSGTVTLEGQPLKEGSIQLLPLENQDTQTGSAIVDGKFTIEKRDGLKPGKYMVRITSGDGVTPANSNEEEAAGPGGSTNIVSVDRIPADWSDQSKQQIEIKAAGDNVFKFEIPKARVIKKKR
jgi:hypothetical protein